MSQSHTSEGAIPRDRRPSCRTSSISALDYSRKSVLTDSLRLQTSESTRKYAALAVILCVFCDAINLQCCAPNYPLMVTPGYPDAFPSTEPFDMASSQYIMPGATQIGVVISNIIFGHLSGKIIGPRKSFFILMFGSAVFTVGKYLARGSFWAFSVLSFVNGLFGASAGTASGYMCLHYRGDRAKVDAYIGAVMAAMVLGRGLGGLLTIFFPRNLFLPLIPAAIINIVALIISYKFVLDPVFDDSQEEEEVGDDSPKSFRKRTLINIVFGAMIDNVGSLAIAPLALSPVMYDAFFLSFVEKGDEPVMSENQYRWLYSMIALIVIPPALATPFIFKKLGIALSCVIANTITACVIIALLFTAEIEPATKGSFALYTCILYVGFSFTIISNLSTGPMLDRVTPLEKKTMIQGVNVAIFDTMGSIFPVVFGLVADKRGNSYFMWICFWISIAAALVNLPLVFDSELGKSIADKQDRVLTEDIDENNLQNILDRGEYVSIEQQCRTNQARGETGNPFLRSKYGKYSQDDDVKFEVSADDLVYLRDMIDKQLANIHDSPSNKEVYVQTLNATRLNKEAMAEMKEELGAWVSDYLQSNGYFMGLENAQLFKGIFMKQFPALMKTTDPTIQNVEDLLVQYDRVLNGYIDGLVTLNGPNHLTALGKVKKI